MTCGARFVVIWALGAAMIPTVVDARSGSDNRLCNIVSAQFDNDEMGGSDRHYTSGFRMACTRSPPSFLNDIVTSNRDPGAITNSWSTYSIGLKMFTTDDLSRRDPIDDDQPYASWLHLGFGLERETIPNTERQRFLDTFHNDGPSVDKEALVGEAQLRLAITWGDIRFGYTHVFRSREFDGQAARDLGSISLSLRL